MMKALAVLFAFVTIKYCYSAVPTQKASKDDIIDIFNCWAKNLNEIKDQNAITPSSFGYQHPTHNTLHTQAAVVITYGYRYCRTSITKLLDYQWNSNSTSFLPNRSTSKSMFDQWCDSMAKTKDHGRSCAGERVVHSPLSVVLGEWVRDCAPLVLQVLHLLGILLPTNGLLIVLHNVMMNGLESRSAL